VNNAVFIRWFESSRIEYLRLLDIELTSNSIGPILAAVSCNFRLQVKYPDDILIGARITRLGNSSVSMQHEAWSKQQSAIVADGDSTVVMYDYVNQKSSPLDGPTRRAITELQGAIDKV
ncbi:MAG: acyl-CoA thioesterase, partial [Pirellulaceae bacterium]